MKKLLLFVSLLVLVASFKSEACSLQINQLAMKNILIGAAANEFHIGLDTVTKITASNVTLQVGGPVPAGSSCEEYADSRSHVTIKYSPNLLQDCELSVDVVRREYLNAETFPFEEYRFELPASSCVTRPLRIKPPVRPLPH